MELNEVSKLTLTRATFNA